MANVELRQRIPNIENLEAVLFYDVGTVDFDQYYHSYGIGFRYNVPFLGQLRLTLPGIRRVIRRSSTSSSGRCFKVKPKVSTPVSGSPWRA